MKGRLRRKTRPSSLIPLINGGGGEVCVWEGVLSSSGVNSTASDYSCAQALGTLNRVRLKWWWQQYGNSSTGGHNSSWMGCTVASCLLEVTSTTSPALSNLAATMVVQTCRKVWTWRQMSHYHCRRTPWVMRHSVLVLVQTPSPQARHPSPSNSVRGMHWAAWSRCCHEQGSN